MNISLPFEIGEEVYILEKDTTEKSIPCNICDGTGIIKLKDCDFPCPECGGNKSKKLLNTVWRKSEPLKITGINIRCRSGLVKSIYFCKKHDSENERRFTSEFLYSKDCIDLVVKNGNNELRKVVEYNDLGIPKDMMNIFSEDKK